jgi:hypothetical protein
VVTINEARTNEGMTMAKKQSKSDKVGRKPTSKAKKSSPGSSRLRPVTAKGKVSAKAMTKLMTKLQQQPPAPQFAAGGGDNRAASADFGAHMQKLMDQQG